MKADRKRWDAKKGAWKTTVCITLCITLLAFVGSPVAGVSSMPTPANANMTESTPPTLPGAVLCVTPDSVFLQDEGENGCGVVRY